MSRVAVATALRMFSDRFGQSKKTQWSLALPRSEQVKATLTTMIVRLARNDNLIVN